MDLLDGGMDDPTPSPTEMAAWARLVRVANALIDSVEADLKTAGHPPLAWYDVLLELERAGPAGLRPVALQQAMLLAQWNLSRLVDRMGAAGLVARRPCPDDRRGQILVATPEGVALRARIWPVYRRAVQRHFAARLGPEDLTALRAVLDRLGPPPRGFEGLPSPPQGG